MRATPHLLAATLLWRAVSVCAAETPSSLFRDEARLAERLLPDAELHLGDGRVTQLSALWQDRPLLITLFYRQCTGTCVPSLRLIRDETARIRALNGDFRILGLSFAASDTAADMRAQAASLGLEQDPNWLFAVAATADVQRLADVLGFWFRRDLASGQYDHPTLLVGVVHGRVVRALLGYPVSREDLRELIWELRDRFVPYYQLPGRSSLRCFEFDPRTGAVRPDWGMILLLAPGVIAMVVTCAVFTNAARARSV
jgi:cytochrome oxidase Cu insertion factor (SCO1/SenC/PrrC family)